MHSMQKLHYTRTLYIINIKDSQKGIKQITWNECSTTAAEAKVEEAKTTKAHASKSMERAMLEVWRELMLA